LPTRRAGTLREPGRLTSAGSKKGEECKRAGLLTHSLCRGLRPSYLSEVPKTLARNGCGGCLLAATGRGQHFGNQHGRVPGRRGSRERGQEPPTSKVSPPLSRKLFGCLEPGPWPNILMIALIHSEFIAVCSHGRVMIRTEDGSGTLIALRWFLPARAR
jgi:hypothetical protein